MTSALLIGLVLTATPYTALSQDPPSVTVEPAPHGAMQSRLAQDAEGSVHLVLRRQREFDLYYTRRGAGSLAWSEPLRVNSVERSAGSFALGVSPAGRVHVLYTASGPYVRERLSGEELRAKDIRFQFHSRLAEDGSSFAPQQNVAGPTWGFEFTGAVAVPNEDEVALFWQGQTEAGPEDSRAIYRAYSDDGGRSFGEVDAAVEGVGACVCCFLDAHVDPEGQVLVAFRGALEGSRRDTYLASAAGAAEPFSARLLDRWRVETCPASMYDFATTAAGTWLTWETRGQVFRGRVSAEGEAEKLAAPGTGRARKRPCLASNARGDVLLAWSEANESLRWQVYDRRGHALLEEPGHAVPEGRRWPAPVAYADERGNFVIVY